MSKGTKPIKINLPVAPKSVDNAVQNLTDAPTKAIGQTLADVWYLVFGGITQAADKRHMKYAHNLKLYEQELSQSVDSISEENLIEPNIQITAQALENSKYCIESKELRTLFVNLISSSMNNDFNKIVHPSFAEIIKQMSPLDAKILKTMEPDTPFPLASYIVRDVQNHDYQTILSNVYLAPFKNISIEQVCSSISSLERLGIIKIVTGSMINDTSFYEPFEKTEYYQNLFFRSKHFEVHQKPQIQKYLGRLTPLGQNFFEVCVE